MNLKEIKEIVSLMKENDLGEIEVEREGSKLKIRKNSKGSGETMVPQLIAPAAPQAAAAPTAAQAAAPSSPAKSGKNIVSPMVGTFYRASSPEAPPYVEVGQVVDVGQVVCIVEAMKLMNEIKSDVKGKIVEIAVDNAEPVEFEQTLFVVEPA